MKFDLQKIIIIALTLTAMLAIPTLCLVERLNEEPIRIISLEEGNCAQEIDLLNMKFHQYNDAVGNFPFEDKEANLLKSEEIVANLTQHKKGKDGTNLKPFFDSGKFKIPKNPLQKDPKAKLFGYYGIFADPKQGPVHWIIQPVDKIIIDGTGKLYQRPKKK